MKRPDQDPTQILDDLRASALSQLLVAGTTAFDVATSLADGPKDYQELCDDLRLAARPSVVLLTGLRALGLIDVSGQDVTLTEYGHEKLSTNGAFNLRGYIGLGAFSVDTQNMIACLKNDAPAGDISYVYHEDQQSSALDDPETSDGLTRAMAARARNVAPFVADVLDLTAATHLVDVGGGHGIYALELLSRYPDLVASVLDREPPLIVACEYAAEMRLTSRVNLVFSDIHRHALTEFGGHVADVILMANILHDYNESDAQRLVTHYASQLQPGGRLVILDAFLDSIEPGAAPISTGPRPVAAYSAMLFSICEGRCYRLDEYQSMMRAAGLRLSDEVLTVPAHGKLLSGFRD